jgi:hypothetical protein
MSRYRPSVSSVPVYLEARSYDDDAAVGSLPSSTSDPQTASSEITNAAAKDINVGRTSAEVGIIIGTLVAFGLICFSLFLLYRKRSDQSVSPLAWWRERKAAAQPAEISISSPMTTRAVASNDGSTLQDAYDEKLNESQQNLVPNASKMPLRQSIMQKIQQVLAGALKSKGNQAPDPVDIERGHSSDSLEDRISSIANRMSRDEWSRRPTSDTEMSIQTESSMALHPAVARIKSQKKKTEPRPGVSAFSWSTSAPTPIPPSHPNMKENPLPPLPSDRDSRRDTTLTTMTEDSEPNRHRSLASWVGNMQKRQEKREQRVRQSISDAGEATSSTKLLAPPPVADPNARKFAINEDGSVRLSGLTVDTNMKTPALETATMAWHVPQGPGQVEVPPMPQSTGRGQNQGLGLQNQNYGHSGQGQSFQEEQLSQEQYSPEEQLQQGQYSQEHEYSQQEGEYSEHTDHSQQYDERQEQECSQKQSSQEQYSQEEQEYYSQQPYPYQEQQEPPKIQIKSPSEATAIPEEDWIPNLTRYPSGTTDRSGFTQGQSG